MQKVSRKGSAVVREAARAAVARDLSSGVYKYVVRLLTPEWLVRRSVYLFGSYYRNGEALCTITGARQGRMSFKKCVSFDRALWEDITGGCIGILEAAGAKSVHEHDRQGGGDGDDWMDVGFIWSV
jgi:hypothetical protein